MDIHLGAQFRALRLWRAGNRDSAFEALNAAPGHAVALDEVCQREDANYTAPLLSTVRIKPGHGMELGWIVDLPQDWPWWRIPGDEQATAEIKAGPRWSAWVSLVKEASS